MSYDKEVADKAAKENKFVVFGGKSKNGLRIASNIDKYLNKNPDVIYNFDWRITGTVDSIRKDLSELNYSEEDILNATQGSGVLTVEDIKDNSRNPDIIARLNKEIEDSNNPKIDSDKYITHLKLEDLVLIGKNIRKNSVIVDIDSGKKKNTVKPRLSLKEFVEKCKKEGKVADLSLLTAEGKKRKCINIPTNLRDKVFIKEWNVLVATEAKLVLALKMMEVSTEDRNEALAYFRNQKNDNNVVTRKVAKVTKISDSSTSGDNTNSDISEQKPINPINNKRPVPPKKTNTNKKVVETSVGKPGSPNKPSIKGAVKRAVK